MPLPDDNVRLPADFDGVFRFTNFTENEFKAKWNNVEYTFPPLKTTPMIIQGATPEEVQHIRKKFAKELAVACFYQTDKFKAQDKIKGDQGMPALYTETDIAPFVQRCLEPLPIAKAIVTPAPQDNIEQKLRKNTRGKNVTKILEDGESLVTQASGPMEE